MLASGFRCHSCPFPPPTIEEVGCFIPFALFGRSDASSYLSGKIVLSVPGCGASHGGNTILRVLLSALIGLAQRGIHCIYFESHFSEHFL